MVAAELGWAVMSPLSICGLTPAPGRVHIVPIPGPQFTRTISVVAADERYAQVASQIAQIATRILRRAYLPDILRLAPWLQLNTDESVSALRLKATPR